jgi:SAM-dependent methyltransferase
MVPSGMEQAYARRASKSWTAKLYRYLEPPLPLVPNPREPGDFPGRWNLYLGGAGCTVPGYVNVDLYPQPGVDVVADAEHLPFSAGTFQRVECDAVLEHVRRPEQVIEEMTRVAAPSGYVHLVTPFCHPFHEYPRDYRRYTLDGLKLLAGSQMTIVAEGWRTGPTATLLVFVLEYVKLLLPWRAWRGLVHFVLGWLLSPFRYLDLLLLKSPRAGQIGNHCFLWLRKP